MIPAILGGLCAALMGAIARAIATGDETEPVHPGFADLPPDDPGRPLDEPVYPRPAHIVLAEPTPTPTTYLHVDPTDQPAEGGRHRAPEPHGAIPAELQSLAAWVAAGCPTPVEWGYEWGYAA